MVWKIDFKLGYFQPTKIYIVSIPNNCTWNTKINSEKEKILYSMLDIHVFLDMYYGKTMFF